ncbi:MAG TPA: thioredoxin family protein [Spirochaetota bacterium]|nr:thioredoxin family protein [Spirochaetota bacterium]HRZ28831.1 thioredoxin family protein [Spirochaetota bacterium]
MKLEILGTGCPKCTKLEEVTRKAAGELGIDAEISKVKEIDKIMGYGVMITPALVVDGVVKVAGKVPSVDEIKKMISK